MTGMANKGLGRGFESLIPKDFDTTVLLSQDERVQKIAIDKLSPNPDQPRQSFDETALAELAESVRQHGVLLPLVVTATKDGYNIVAGERRWRAAKIAKLTSVPAIVRTLKEIEQLEISLIENVQRVDLSPLEQAVSIERLHGQFNMSYDQIAKRLGKAGSTISNTVRLLQLPAKMQKFLNQNVISEGHARSLLALKDDTKHQDQLLHNIVDGGWSVRQAERFVIGIKQGAGTSTVAKKRVATETPTTKLLSKRFGTPVQIRHTAHGGKLEISFKDDDELQKIIDLLKR